jgi:hypothetical protein
LDNVDINRRDKVSSKFNFPFKHTNDIIRAQKENRLPSQIMFNIHPEHWADSILEWFKIWLIRKLKNSIKRVLIKIR